MRFRSGGLWYEHSILLAPPLATLIAPFRSVHEDHVQHDWLLAEAQRLRARVYLEDGAIEAAQVSASGRFVHPLDRDSWHLLTLNSDGEVSGCLRYSQMDLVSFYRLEVARSALARSREWGMRLRHAVERKRADARFRGVAYAELGGWALTEKTRGSREALRMTLTVYALTQFLGGAVGTTTATKRHHSSTILRKLGGTPLVSDGMELPAYYDPQYKCEMEILAFDSDCPNPKYRSCIDDYRQDIANLTVICAEPCLDTSRVEYRRPIGVPANGVSLSPVLN
jgi:hypothetical protein